MRYAQGCSKYSSTKINNPSRRNLNIYGTISGAMYEGVPARPDLTGSPGFSNLSVAVRNAATVRYKTSVKGAHARRVDAKLASLYRYLFDGARLFLVEAFVQRST